MAKDQTLSTLFREIVWPLAWRSAVIGATMGLGALAMIKYLRGDGEKAPEQQPPPVESPSPKL